jgi:hypothetical protein
LQSDLNVAVPNPNTVTGIVIGGPGEVKVVCTVGTPVKDGDVYMRVVAGVGMEVGDLEADADGTDNVLLENVVWALSNKDTYNVSAVRIKY